MAYIIKLLVEMKMPLAFGVSKGKIIDKKFGSGGWIRTNDLRVVRRNPLNREECR